MLLTGEDSKGVFCVVILASVLYLILSRQDKTAMYILIFASQEKTVMCFDILAS